MCVLVIGNGAKPAYAAGTYGAKLPAASANHYHQLAGGLRSAPRSQANPFSRSLKGPSTSRQATGTLLAFSHSMRLLVGVDASSENPSKHLSAKLFQQVSSSIA